jgi:hypothetical protein
MCLEKNLYVNNCQKPYFLETFNLALFPSYKLLVVITVIINSHNIIAF